MTQSGHFWRSSLLGLCQLAGEEISLRLRLRRDNDKAKPVKRRGRKATGPLLREATDDSPMNQKIAELPSEPPAN